MSPSFYSIQPFFFLSFFTHFIASSLHLSSGIFAKGKAHASVMLLMLWVCLAHLFFSPLSTQSTTPQPALWQTTNRDLSLKMSFPAISRLCPVCHVFVYVISCLLRQARRRPKDRNGVNWGSDYGMQTYDRVLDLKHMLRSVRKKRYDLQKLLTHVPACLQNSR